MHPYSESYLKYIVEQQGKLFDYVANEYQEKDTADFIVSYMNSETRKSIDKGQAYVCTMDYKELLNYFLEIDGYSMKEGVAIKGFGPWWIGEFYAYYQWYYNIPSSAVLQKVPLVFLEKAYFGLHDLDLKLAVEKVGYDE